jgi:hypothetical protein
MLRQKYADSQTTIRIIGQEKAQDYQKMQAEKVNLIAHLSHKQK